MSKKLSWRKPLYNTRTGERLDLIHRYPNGNLVVSSEDFEVARTVDAYGWSLLPKSMQQHRKQLVSNTKPKPVETVEYLSLYPTSQVYKQHHGPVRASTYGVENLIQIKITRRDGRIVKKEFV